MANTPRFHRRHCLLAGPGLLVSALFDTSLAIADAPELVVIVHPSNPIHLSSAEIAAVFKTTKRYWSGDKNIVALNLPTRNSDRALFDRVVLGLDPDAVLRFWIDRKIRGGEPPPRSVPEAELVLRIVQQLDSAIGYVPRQFAKSGVRVIARVLGDRVETATTLIARRGI